MDSGTPIVVDLGSGETKCGYAGDKMPKHIFPSIVGRPKRPGIMFGLEKSVFVGESAKKKRGLLRLKYPIEHGMVTNWNDMEEILEHIYSENAMSTNPKNHPVLLPETPLVPRANRKKMAEILFEKFGVPSYFTCPGPVCTLFYYGKVTGCVIESGDGVSHACPILDGQQIDRTIRRYNIGGRDCTDYLSKILCERGYELVTSKEREIVKDIKEKLCYVVQDVTDDLRRCDRSGIDKNGNSYEKPYLLPDGFEIEGVEDRKLIIGSERFRAPEIIFSPSWIGCSMSGLSEVVCYSITSIGNSDRVIQSKMFSNIVLGGGCNLFPGIGERFEEDIQALAPTNQKVKVYTKKNLNLSTWIGGSIAGNLSILKEMWLSKSTYDEMGGVSSSKLQHWLRVFQSSELGRVNPFMLVLRKAVIDDEDLKERSSFLKEMYQDENVDNIVCVKLMGDCELSLPKMLC